MPGKERPGERPSESAATAVTFRPQSLSDSQL